jgi:hypothetical protein
MKIMNCCKCNKPIPKPRLKALPNTKECIECSSEERNMVRAVITGKTTYSEVEVIKNKKTKEYLNKLIGKGRRGFGSMLHRSTGSDTNPSKVTLGSGTGRILRIPTKEDFDRIGKQVMWHMELGMHTKADRIMKEALENRVITGIQYRQLKGIIEHINNE